MQSDSVAAKASLSIIYTKYKITAFHFILKSESFKGLNYPLLKLKKPVVLVRALVMCKQ